MQGAAFCSISMMTASYHWQHHLLQHHLLLAIAAPPALLSLAAPLHTVNAPVAAPFLLASGKGKGEKRVPHLLLRFCLDAGSSTSKRCLPAGLARGYELGMCGGKGPLRGPFSSCVIFLNLSSGISRSLATTLKGCNTGVVVYAPECKKQPSVHFILVWQLLS